MINYDDTLKIPLDAMRTASAPLMLPTPNAAHHPTQTTPVSSYAPVTPIPATPLDCHMQHDRIRREFKADMLYLYFLGIPISVTITILLMYVFRLLFIHQ